MPPQKASFGLNSRLRLWESRLKIGLNGEFKHSETMTFLKQFMKRKYNAKSEYVTEVIVAIETKNAFYGLSLQILFRE